MDGIVVAVPDRGKPAGDDGRLPRWSGSLLEPRNMGCWVEPRTAVCVVGDPAGLEGWALVDQADIPEVAGGQTARVWLEQQPLTIFEATVLEVGRRSIELGGPGLAAGPRRQDDQDTSGESRNRYHLLRLRLDQQSPLLVAGATGSAKIETSRTTLAEIVSRYLKRVLRLPW